MTPSWRALAALPVAAAALGLGIGAGFGTASDLRPPSAAAATATQVSATTPLTSAAISSLIGRVEPAVVTIYTTVPSEIVETPFGQRVSPPTTGIGTGLIVGASGLILTNNHVVADAQSIQVRVNGYTSRLKGTVVGTDDADDLALIKVSASKALPTLTLATDASAAPIGAFAIAIGAPDGLYDTATFGIISAKGRSLTVQRQVYKSLVQTDAPISPGNSGGPLVNLAGQVIGVNTAIDAAGQNLGFAIPASVAQKAIVAMQPQG